MLANMYKEHSVRLDICGTDDSISKITADILYQCYNTFYNLSNMALCISGDVTPEQVMKVADKILKKSEPVVIERYDYKEPEGVITSVTERKLKVSRPLFNIGLKDCDTGFSGRELTKKSWTLNILSDMMFGKSSEFYTRLYNAGIINNSFGAGYQGEVGYAYMTWGGEADNPQEIMDEIIKEYEDKIKTGLDREDFERIKRSKYAGTITMFENTSSIANMLIDCLFMGTDILDLPEIVAEITFEDAQAGLEKLFKRENFILSVINPID